MIDRLLADIGRNHYGIVPTADLVPHDISRRQIQRRLDDGRLIRLHGKVLAIGGAPQTWEFWAAAALAACPIAVLSHNSAAHLHQIWVPNSQSPITICGPVSAHHDLDGVSVRRTRRLLDSHTTVAHGFRVTTRARTVIDLAATLSDGRIKRIIEDELVSRRTSWERFEATFLTTAKRGRKGIAKMRRVLAELDDAPTSESELERRFIDLIARSRLPAGITQAPAPWSEKQLGRVDYLYESERLLIELDGRRFHLRESEFERDRWRDQQALLHGLRPVRFTWRQVTSDPDYVVETIDGLLNAQIPPQLNRGGI